MIEVVSDGPFSATSHFWQRRHGETVCTVVAKATFELRPQELVLVDDPLPVEAEDDHWDGDPTSSVRLPGELAPFKRAPEVVVVGHAFAPQKRAVTDVLARLVVGSVDKTLRVFAPRAFGRSGELDASATATRFSLRWESAGGGPGSENPVGIDVDRADAKGVRVAPSLVPIEHRLSSPSDFVPIVGFGPLATTWPGRARLLRAEDRAWLSDPLAAPLPPGFDAGFFQVAPRDQWLDAPFRAGERLILEGLHAAHERLVTNLPGLSPRAILVGTHDESLPLVADTMVIDTDRALLTLVWRGQTAFEGAMPRFQVVILPHREGESVPPASLAAGQTLAVPSGARVVGARTTARHFSDPMTESVIETTNIDEGVLGPPSQGLPFVGRRAPMRPPTPSQHDALPFRSQDERDDTADTMPPMQRGAAPGRAPARTAPVPSKPPPPPTRAGRSAPPPLPARATGSPPPPPVRGPVTTPPPPISPARSTSEVPAAMPGLVPPASVARAADPAAPPSLSTAVLSTSTLAGLEPPRAPASLSSLGATSMPASAPAPLAPLTTIGQSASTLGQTSSGLGPAPTTVGQSATAGGGGQGPLRPAFVAAADPAANGKRPLASAPASFDNAFGAPPAASPTSGVRAASDAAAHREAARPQGTGAVGHREAALAEDAPRRHAMVDLLSFDGALPERLRRDPTIIKLLGALPRPARFRRTDEATEGEEDKGDRGRLDVLRVMSFAAPQDLARVRDAIGEAFDDPTRLELPLAVVTGELRPTFDDLEALKAGILVAQPLAGASKALASAVKIASDSVASSWPPTGDAAATMLRQIEQACTTVPSLPARYLSGQIERALTEERRYRRRTIAGATRVRGELAFSRGDTIPIYLPETLVERLPMLPSFAVTAIVELRPREDAGETSPDALLALAIGRVVRAAEGR